MVKQYPCHKLPKSQRCDCNGPGGFMGHTCGPQRTRTLQEIIREHLSFGLVSKRGKDSIRFLSLCCAGEAGELANDVKKQWRGDRKYQGKAGEKLWRAKIESEVVDLGNYVFMFAERLGINLQALMEAKLIEVEERDDDWNKVYTDIADVVTGRKVRKGFRPVTGAERRAVGKQAVLAKGYGSKSHRNAVMAKAGFHPDWKKLSRTEAKRLAQRMSKPQARALKIYYGF